MSTYVPSVTATQPLPCDRGMPGNAQSRGWHHFEAGPTGVVVCRYCGARPPAPEPPSLRQRLEGGQ